MQGLIPLADALHDLGMLVYGGPMVAFTVLLALSGRMTTPSRRDIVRTYRAFGAGLGLSMGAWVLGLLARHALLHGGFVWGLDTPGDRLLLATHAVFALLWIWNIRIEIWSLEPLRKLDGDDVAADTYAAAVPALTRDLGIQSVLVLAYFVLEHIAGG